MTVHEIPALRPAGGSAPQRCGALRVRRRRPGARVHHPGARARAPDRAPRGDRGRDAAGARRPRARAAAPARRWRCRPAARTASFPPATARAACACSCARRATPRRSSRGSPRCRPRAAQPLGLSAPARGRRAGARLRRRGPCRQAAAARPAGAVRALLYVASSRVRVRRRVGRRGAAGGGLRRARRRAHVPAVVAAGLRRRGGGRPTGGRRGLAPPLQGPPAVRAEGALADHAPRPAARGLDRGRRRPARAGHVDADADRARHARALRLARVRRPAAAAPAHADRTARVPRGTTPGRSRARCEGLEAYAQTRSRSQNAAIA